VFTDTASSKVTAAHLSRAALLYLLTELAREFAQFRRDILRGVAMFRPMIERDGQDRDLRLLVVPRVGSLPETGDVWEP
jgi:hypothetical protein